MYENILVLEEEELTTYDVKTGNIGIDKSIFDDFVEGALVQVRFVNDYVENHVHAYEMIFEDNNTIFLRYLWDEFI